METKTVKLSKKVNGNHQSISLTVSIGINEAINCGLISEYNEKNMEIEKILDVKNRQIILKEKTKK